MTDSIRCTADALDTFTCEVQLDSDFETLTCEAPEPAPPPPPPPPPPAPNPAVSSLVSTFVSRTLVPLPPAPLISGAALLTCASSELSIGLAAAAGKGPVVTGLMLLKAGLDAGSCLAQARDKAAQRNAERYCTEQGGVVKGVVGDKTTCEVRELVK